jgi:hypothetical protein
VTTRIDRQFQVLDGIETIATWISYRAVSITQRNASRLVASGQSTDIFQPVDRQNESDNDVDAVSDTETWPSDQRADLGRRAPAWAIHALIVVATVLGVLSGLSTWVERQLLDTDQWVKVADELIADDEVRGVLAAYLVDELYDSVDVAEELGTRLPEDVDGLGGLVAAALRGPATGGVERLLNTDVFRGLWVDVNEKAHETLVRILRDDTRPSISTADGSVTLDLGELVKQVGKEFGLSLNVVDKLPEDVGVVTIVESDDLDAAQDAVRLIETLSVVLFVLAVLVYAAALYLAGQRRRETIREVGLALMIGSALVLVGLWLAVGSVGDAAGLSPGAEGAARAAATIGTGLLRGLAMAGLAFGALVVGYAALAGPSATARRLREMLVPALLTRPVVAWSAAAALLAVALYFAPGDPLQSWVRGLIFVALLIAAFEALRRQLAHEFTEALPVSANLVEGEPTGSDVDEE